MNHGETVYIETSIVSYLTARATNNLVAAAWQITTAQWWDSHSSDFDLYTSILTIQEAGRGHPEAAARRLEALEEITVLPITDAVVALSDALVRGQALPPNARNDAVHIAVSVVHGISYLLTWNFRHIANAATRPLIDEICERRGYRSSIICTPSELMGGRDAV